MAESIVSFAAQHIEHMIAQGSKALSDARNEAKAMHSELTTMMKYLIDAEGRNELANNQQVRTWLAELRRIAYEAEDVVDILVSESAALKYRYLGLYCILKLPLVHRASKKLHKLREQMREVKSKIDQYAEGSRDSKKEIKSRARGSQAPKGYLHADDDFVIGIDGDVKKLVSQLTGKCEDGQPPVDILAIIGMGGSGKTTLARKIYNHQVVKKHFHFQAWVSISRGWNTSDVLVQILGQIRGKRTRFFGARVADEVQSNEPQVLMSRLANLLKNKRCLVVLDDLWDSKAFNKFIDMIQQNETSIGSHKIVVTSRQRPPLPSDSRLNWIIHDKQCLTEENSWKLFSKVASNSGKDLGNEYKVLAMQMLRKCQGLPLAIVALARLLKTKDNMREWERVFSQIEGSQGRSLYQPVNDIMALSYDELPYYLKPCFLYLALFPEGSTISAGTLIRMWRAEGFMPQQRQSRETSEDVASKYLQELIDHTMVQVVRKTHAGKVKTIRVHDIMRDLCIIKARELDFLSVYSSQSEDAGKGSRRATVNISKHLTLPVHNKCLRSLVLYGQPATGVDTNQGNKSTINLALAFEKFKLLRVLDVLRIRTADGTMPRDVGSLVHLRYLRIRSTNIRELPKSIGKLRNLMTLDYWDVSTDNGIILPNVLWKMKQLRHIYLPNEMNSTKDNLKLHTVKDLHTLWGIKGGNWMLKEMNTLSSNLNKLYIHGISSSKQLEAVFNSPIIQEHQHLYALALDWYGFSAKSLDALCSKESLKKLRLMGRAPDNLRSFQFPKKLTKLELYYTLLEQTDTMVALGRLPVLKFLRLSKDSYIASEWTCSKGAFPALEELKLSNLPKLEKWEMEKGTMPHLKKLSIISCVSLKHMPEGLMFMDKIDKLDIERMPTDFCSRLQKVKWNETSMGGEDLHIIKHISHIGIRDSHSALLY